MLAQYASVLEREGHKCEILDCVPQKITRKGSIEILKKFGADIMVVNITTHSFDDDIKYVQYVTSNLNLPIVAVGPHGTAEPESLLQNGVDVVIRGEAESTILELTEKIGTSKQVYEARNVRGISYVENGRVFNNATREWIQKLDLVPFPARHLLDQSLYKNFNVHGRWFTIIRGSRGCPYNCTFCSVSKLSGRKIRFRSPQNIVDEMMEVVKNYRISVIHFFDDLFTANRQHVMDLCKEILRRKLSVYWFANTRADTVDLEMMRVMKKAGCVGVTLGVESGSQKILDGMEKQAKVEDFEKGIMICKKAGLLTYAYFIIGFPNETNETIEETITFIRKAKPDAIAIERPIPIPGTELYEYAKKEGVLQFDSWNAFALKLKEGFYVKSRFMTREKITTKKRAMRRELTFRNPGWFLNRFMRIKEVGLKNVFFCRYALNRIPI